MVQHFRAGDGTRNREMSQIASFVVLKASTVPDLAIFSKPKPRLFRRPDCMFSALLRPHVLQEFIFDAADGVYVALVFAWIDLRDKTFSRESDPVIDCVRKNLGGCHWLLKFADQRLLPLLCNPINEVEWPAFLVQIGCDNCSTYDLSIFSEARLFVHNRLSELGPTDAMLVSIG